MFQHVTGAATNTVRRYLPNGNPASPLNFVHTIGSLAQSSMEPLSGATLSPVKSSDISSSGLQFKLRGSPSVRNNDINNSSLRQLCCKIILTGLEFSLKPVTYAEIFNHMLNLLGNWDQRQHGVDESDIIKSCRFDKTVIAWLHSCLDVIWLLVDEGKCRVPFYELLRSDFYFIENIPDDETLFTLILEIHRRRDMMALHMQMLDQHLHCPTFGTHRILNHTTPTISSEAVAHLRLSPLSYLSVLGEPLHGEDITTSIQKGSLGWERVVCCIRHALCTTPSPDWWRRVLVLAPCYMPSSQGIIVGAVFSLEMICEAVIDRIIIRIELVMNALNSDSRKVETQPELKVKKDDSVHEHKGQVKKEIFIIKHRKSRDEAAEDQKISDSHEDDWREPAEKLQFQSPSSLSQDGNRTRRIRRRTPSREREQEQCSSSIERRFSISPVRRSSDTSTLHSARNNTSTSFKPAKVVYVPATVTSFVTDKSNNSDCGESAAATTGTKRITVRRNVGAASPHSQSPAKANGNATEHDLEPTSLLASVRLGSTDMHCSFAHGLQVIGPTGLCSCRMFFRPIRVCCSK
ncbi:hypothetical protein KIW84_012920 [Lathyrus oleraceus]|uniref:Uncharacterized protein n=1 Tax=Pisum sativum TaxID=3888 RepID=A0A9D5GXF2_PEA|nr:hypothetical protein KIW84_012920 [Pisum sativum]